MKQFLKFFSKIFFRLLKKLNFESILEKGIYLLVFLLPLQTRYFLKEASLGGAFWEYASFSIYLIDILLVLLFLVSTVEIYRNKRKLKIQKVWYLLGVFELFVFFSIFFSDSISMAIYAYIKILLAFLLFYLISETKLDDKKITLSFLSGVFIQALFGLIQFFNNYAPASKYLGMAEHKPSVLGTFVIELADKTRVLRAYGGFDHPNIYGVFIFLGIFIYVRYLLTLKNRNSISSEKYFRYFFILAFLFFSFLVSFSRAAYLIFILYIFFIVVWSFYDKNRRELILKILAVFFTVFLISFYFYNNLYLQRINPISRLDNISNQERLGQVVSAKQIIKNNFWFGVGINNYTNKLRQLDSSEKEAWNYPPVHNVYLLVLAELGFFGFLSFISIFLYFFYKCFKKKLFFDLFLIFLLSTLFLFDHWFWSLHFGIIFLFFILALIQRKLYQ